RAPHAAFLRHPADSRAGPGVCGLVRDVAALPRESAAMKPRLAEDRGDERRLAYAVATQQSDTFALLDRERHVLDDDRFAVARRHRVEREDRAHARSAPR